MEIKGLNTVLSNLRKYGQEAEKDIEWSFITLQIHGCGCCGRDDDKVTHWAELP